MPRKSKTTVDVEVDVEALVAEVAELKKEVASLKQSRERSSSVGKDERVGKIIELLKRNKRRKIVMEEEYNL